MKRKILILLLSFLAISGLCFEAFAQEYCLSQGLEIIKSKTEVKKCTVKDTALSFSPSDFESVMGKIEYLTIASLPDEKNGKLMLGSEELREGTTISRRSIEALRFEPKKGTLCTASFIFCDPQKTSCYGVCTVYVLEKENLAPAVSEISVDTMKNISCKGFLEAKDPENDKLSYSVVSAPKHGILKLEDEKSGLFMYTPRTDFTGRDTFKFRVSDSYGNRSEVCRVVIHINEPPTETFFYDMTNHWAHSSAIEVFSDRVLSADIFDGKLVFSPDEKITRGDFLAVAMIASGLENEVERTYSTPFLDDNKIPMNIKSYAAKAYDMGIIKGYPEKGGVSFRSEDVITRRDARIILERIVSLCTDEETGVLAVSAKGSADLADLGILVGVGGGEQANDMPVTKAQLARIYCNLKNLRR